MREQEFNLHALNKLLEVLISLPRALREGDEALEVKIRFGGIFLPSG